MDISGIGASPSRLLQALERLGVSSGADLRSPAGPSGAPDAELVRAFLEALEGPAADPAGGGPHGEMPESGQPGGQPFGDAAAESAQGALAPPDAVAGAEPPGQMPDPAVDAARAAEATPPVHDPAAASAPEAMRGAPERIAAPHETDTATHTPEPEPVGEAAREQVREAGRDAGRDVGQDVGRDSVRETGRAAHAEGASQASPPEPAGAQATGQRTGGPDAQLRELGQLLERVAGGQPSPTELYRLQYMMGMLRLQASSGVQLSQQGSQGLETLLKQQG